jgi:nucleoside-diphosphate-sugar epimerase
MLGGLPRGIVQRFVAAAVAADRRAIDTLGHALASADRPLVAAFATMAMKPGRLATEDDAYSPTAIGAARGATEDLMHAMALQGIRTSIIRLPPTVHGAGDHGFVSRIIQVARKKKESAYLGDGQNRWPAVHRLDVARLFRLALESGPAGGTYHGVAEEGIPFGEIAQLIGRRLNVPVVSKTPAEAGKQFSFLSGFVAADNPVSSKLTQERLGWRPAGPGLLTDLEREGYFED